MPASAGLHCRGHCRRDIVGAQDKVSDREIPGGIHECSSGLTFSTRSGNPKLHSGL
ncbi:unnamed protein product, partial [Staurois parvus]